MRTYWLYPAAASLLLGAAPVFAEDKAPEAPTPAPSPVQTAMGGTGQPGTTGQPAEKKPEPPPPPKFTYGGSTDFYWEYNFNKPFNHFNNLRAFDVKDQDGVHLGLIDLWAQYARDPVGFRLDLDWGNTAELVNAFEPSDSDIWEHIEQAYISVNLDGKKGRTYVDFGKWVTTAGFEVIEPKDNWLYTRGLLFNLAIPFYHMGLRGYHYFNDTDYVMAGVHRGWNAVGYPDHGPGFVVAGSKKLSDKWTAIGNFYGGEEGPTLKSGKEFRSLVDLIFTYSPGGRWSYAFNPDIDVQGSSTLYGLAAYAKYQVSKKGYLAARGEFLIDDGFVGSDVYSLTLGYTHMFNKYFQTKAEFRYDWASEDVFFDDTPPGKFGTGMTSNQPTFVISAILNYN